MSCARQLPSDWTARPDAIILVVDDDSHVRQTIRYALEGEGLLVDEAVGHRDALAVAARCQLALVVLDITPPGSDSSVLAAALRAAQGADLPILVVTAGGHAREKADRVGAFAYLRKPFDLDDLLAAVRRGLTAS